MAAWRAERRTQPSVSTKPFAWDDQDVEDVAIQMSDAQVRRMPVLSREGERLVGIVSIGDLVKRKIAETQAEAEGLKAYISAG